MKSSASGFSRCRPLLGTYVEVSLSGASGRTLREAAARAYAEIEEVSKSMCFHDPASELSRLNRVPVGRWMRASAGLREVLALALELQAESGGRFNVAVADPLVAWRVLPGRIRTVDWARLADPAFEIGAGRCRRIAPVRIDLGGVAKGYAVDRAVEAIRRRSREISGVVNAGGDLRVFGESEHAVWVRAGDPSTPVLRRALLRNQAIATSSAPRGPGRSPYVDIRRRSASRTGATAVVRAERCVLADALTKVALLAPRRDFERIAASYGAEVSVLS